MAFGDVRQSPIEVLIDGAKNGFKDPNYVNSSKDAMYSDFGSLLSDLNKKASSGDDAAFEKLFDYYASRQAEKTARDWTAEREDNQYQRLMADIKKAGISPYMLTGLNPAVSQADFSATTGSQMSTAANSKRSAEIAAEDRGANIVRGLLSLAGTALMALAILG